MFYRKSIYGILLSLLALAIVLGIIISYSLHSRDLKVIFLDVGQGDAILISQGGNQILIDGGKSGKTALEKLGKYIPFWDRTIEVLVATHPDQDHIGGLIDVAKTYNIETVLETGAKSDSQTFKAWEEEINKKPARKVEAMKGAVVKFPGGSEAKILYPFSPVNPEDKSNSNQYSVVIKLTMGENSFLFTGDLPAGQELPLMDSQVDIKSDILKVAHHGSKYSTSDEFLGAVRPAEAVISAGKNNTYGHPAEEVLERLRKRGIKIWRTDESGDIEYKCKNENEKCEVEFQ